MHILHTMCRIIFKKEKLINQNLFVSSTIHTCMSLLCEPKISLRFLCRKY